jgi:hypothetical protein
MTSTDTKSAEQVRAEQVTTSHGTHDGDQLFTIVDGATYILRENVADVAEFYGCPGYDAVLVGGNSHTLGNLRIATGTRVRIPRSGGQFGYRGHFNSPGLADGTLAGYVIG